MARLRTTMGWGLLAAAAAAVSVAVVAIALGALLGEDGREAAGGERLTAAQYEDARAAAIARLTEGNYERALVVAEGLTRDRPDEQAGWLVLGEALAGLGRMEEAYGAYSNAVTIGPDSAEYRFLMGTIAAQMGDFESAETQYGLAQQQAPGNPKHPLYRAQVQRELGRADDARASLAIALKLDDTLAIGWGTLAAMALDEGRPQPALDHARKARALEPGNLVWRTFEAKALRRTGDAERAAELLMAAELGADPIAAKEMLRELGVALGELGRPGVAAREYAAAAEVWPEDAGLLFEASLWAERAGDVRTALRFAERATLAGHPMAGDLAASLRERLRDG